LFMTAVMKMFQSIINNCFSRVKRFLTLDASGRAVSC